MGNAAEVLARCVADGDCLRWTGAHNPKGYGQVRVDGKARSVHIVVYEEQVEPVPSGYEVDHKCFVRDCCRKEHLEAVTVDENRRRQAARRSTCPSGHPYTGVRKQRLRNGEMGIIRVCHECWRIRAARARARRAG